MGGRMISPDDKPSYIVGHVPAERVQRDWKLDIKTKEQYDFAVASGLAWVVYKDFPFTWEEAEEDLMVYEIIKGYN